MAYGKGRQHMHSHVKCPTLGEGPLIDPLVKAPHRPRRGIVGDLIDKCISSFYLAIELVVNIASINFPEISNRTESLKDKIT